jgi:hypothetical protein
MISPVGSGLQPPAAHQIDDDADSTFLVDEASPPPPKIKIDFYGGSLSSSVGRDFDEYESKRFSTIFGEKLGAHAVNKAIPASGPSFHFVCGIEPTDIISIISEFRINEGKVA